MQKSGNRSHSRLVRAIYSKIDSNDVTSATESSSNVNVIGKSVMRSGDVVFVYIDVAIPDSYNGTYTSYEVLTGLPKPKYKRSFLGGVSIDGVFTQPAFEITTDGKLYLQVRGTAVNGKRIFSTVMYIL